MNVGDLVRLKHKSNPSLGIILKSGTRYMGYDNWVLVMFVDEEGPGWFMQYNLKPWSEDENG